MSKKRRETRTKEREEERRGVSCHERKCYVLSNGAFGTSHRIKRSDRDGEEEERERERRRERKKVITLT